MSERCGADSAGGQQCRPRRWGSISASLIGIFRGSESRCPMLTIASTALPKVALRLPHERVCQYWHCCGERPSLDFRRTDRPTSDRVLCSRNARPPVSQSSSIDCDVLQYGSGCLSEQAGERYNGEEAREERGRCAPVKRRPTTTHAGRGG